MATLITRINGIRVITEFDGTNYVSTTETEFAPTYSASQLFVSGNLAMIDAVARGDEFLATDIVETYGFIDVTLADCSEWTRNNWEEFVHPNH